MSTKAAALIALAILAHAVVSWHQSTIRHQDALASIAEHQAGRIVIHR